MKAFQFYLATMFIALAAWAGPDTTLASPDHDVKRLFPESTTYRVRSLPASETTRHGFYAVYKDKVMIGLIYGVTRKVVGGELELFTAFNQDGHVRDIYFQKIDSRDAPHFRSKFYRQQFKKFSLGKSPEYSDVIPPMRLPQPNVLKDHHLVVDSVRFSIDIVKNFYNDAKAAGP